MKNFIKDFSWQKIIKNYKEKRKSINIELNLRYFGGVGCHSTFCQFYKDRMQ